MLALRYVYVLALVVWLGGMVILGAVVAPSVFQVLQSHAGIPAAAGRVAAGDVFGTVLARFHLVSYACGFLLLAALSAVAVLGPRPRSFAVRSGIIVVMLGIALYSGVIVSGTLDDIQTEIGEGISPSTLPETDPRRLRFDSLHVLSTRLMMVNILGALVLLYWETKE